MKTISGSKRLGADPGHEFSGVVAALGEDVTGIEGGQEV
jgi:D-arabinose 1-dehydrogenase-like Zn-dependent alcohol dehydrogenase